MKFLLAAPFLLVLIVNVQGQNYIGLRGGIVDVDFISDYGSNYEFYYEGSLNRLFDVGLAIGQANQDSYPSFYKSPGQNMNFVHPVVDDYIMNANPSQIRFFGWDSNAISYFELYGKINILLKLPLGLNLGLKSGLSRANFHVTRFTVRRFSVNLNTNRITSYEPQYQVVHSWESAWTLGIALRKELSILYRIELDYKYYLPFFNGSTSDFIPQLGLLRIGIARRL